MKDIIHFGHGIRLKYGKIISVLCIITLTSMLMIFLSSCDGIVRKANYSYEELSEELVSIQICKLNENNIEDFGFEECEITVISTIESKEEIEEILNVFSTVDIRVVCGRPSQAYSTYGIMLNYTSKHLFFSRCKIYFLDSDYMIDKEKDFGYYYDIAGARQADEYYEILEKYGCSYEDYVIK